MPRKSQKLAHKVLRSLAVRVSIVVIFSSLFSYWHLYVNTKKGIVDTIGSYTHERAERESVIFDLARKNHELVRPEVEKLAQAPLNPEYIKRFDKLLVRLPDGTTRNRKELYDGTSQVGVFIPSQVKITPEFKSFIVGLMDITFNYGRTFRSHFQDTYFTTPENVMVIYWPEAPNWTMEMKADFDMTKEEYVWIADAAHNPTRATVWTGMFYDVQGKMWMASGETPIYVKDRHLATLGHDVMLSELTARISNEQTMPGAYSLIVRDDGRLIAHPEKKSEIEKSDGKYEITAEKDPYLHALVHTVVSAKTNREISHPANGDLLIHSPIKGPGWTLVTVFPSILITSTALQGVGFIFLIAFVSLLIEMFFLYFVVQKEVNEPIEQLSHAASELQAGRASSLDLGRNDELGKFANTFNEMSRAIAARDQELKKYADSLEQKVNERTKQLERQRAAAAQNAKMASLGEMAGGVAHEINNPLAIIAMHSQQGLECLDDAELDKEILRQKFQLVVATTTRIASIVKGLLAFSRRSANDAMLPTSVKEILAGTVGLCGERFKHHDVELRLGAFDDFKIPCRGAEVSQIVLNLLGNAFDAVGPLPEKWVACDVKRLGDKLQISVTDSGKGLKPELVDRIMEPFFTTKEVGKGTGLGLSISKSIAEAHHGNLYVDQSCANTRFVLELPLTQAGPATKAA